MRTVIAGSRTLERYDLLCLAIRRSGFSVSDVISGGARGVDTLGERWSEQNLGKKARVFEAEWDRYGRYRAGPIRNGVMAVEGEGLIALMWGKSKGTKDMVEQMRGLGKPVYLERYPAHQLAPRADEQPYEAETWNV